MSFSQKKYKKNNKTNSRKIRKNKKTNNRKIRKNRKTHKNKYNKKYYGGGRGEWVNQSNSKVQDEACAICLEKFQDTPEQAIYETECGHVFHNNCINNLCESGERNRFCPMCREPLGTDCDAVWAFKEKVLANPRKETPYFDDKEIQDIYENQSL